MNKLLVSLLLCLSVSTYASTDITTSYISGHWTLSGSPYRIFKDIEINGSLKIDPGVEVIFQGPYGIYVSGHLNATGTLSQPILFHLQDTTGWFVDTSAKGGWNGISFHDKDTLSYCNFSYMKKSGLMLYNTNGRVSNCKFFQNKSRVIQIMSDNAGFQPEISGCDFYDNSGIVLFLSGMANVHDNKIHDNGDAPVVYGSGVTLLFESNEVYKNKSVDGTIQFMPNSADVINHVTLRGNKIHDNINQRTAAVHCYDGIFIIDRNIICNNRHDSSGNCGEIYGGGGLFLNGQGADLNRTYYTVSNNIIANNSSADFGGGIELFQTNASVINNQIINNSSSTGAGLYIFSSPFVLHSHIKIKNNIFYNNATGHSWDTTAILVGVADTVEFDHNWIQHDEFNALSSSSNISYLYLAGSTTNIIGTDPGLISPTLTTSVTESALTANFGLSSTSPCINKGTSAGIVAGIADYANNHRVFSTSIDIGAFEYGSSSILAAPAVTTETEQTLLVYPNPATNKLFVSVPEAKGTLMLMDITGKKTAETNVSGTLTSFDIHDMPRGVYFAIWSNGMGAKMVQKVAVE